MPTGNYLIIADDFNRTVVSTTSVTGDTTTSLTMAATKVDDQAQKLATTDGTVGDVAEKAHEVLDKVDGD